MVSDDLVVNIIKDRISEKDCRGGFILDGFPRTTAQAESLDAMLEELGKSLDAVIEIKVDDNALVERISGRFTCSDCGEGYNKKFKVPAVDGVCDICGGSDFSQRSDDNAETVAARLESYHAQTSPLIPYYDGRGALVSVDGMLPIAEVMKNVNDVLKRLT